MIDEIYKSYLKYRQAVLEGYKPFEYLKAIIKMPPESFLKLLEETSKNHEYMINTCEGIHFIILGGEKTPIIIDDKMPKGVVFQILSRTDYEREECEKIFKKTAKIFDD